MVKLINMTLRRKKSLVYNGISFLTLMCIISTLRMMHHAYTSRQVKVLIVAYMRSGSTLTGDILQHSEGSFYVYEPLRSIYPDTGSSIISEDVVYANGIKQWAPIAFSKEAYTTLYKWFTCDMNQLPTAGFFDVFLKKGRKTATFFSCYKDATLRTMNHTYAMGKCLRNLTRLCENSSVKVIKTIRVYIKEVKHLLEETPDLKIIHIIRDPRAMLFSQSHFRMCSGNLTTSCSRRLCNKLADDVLESEFLSARYPNRIMTLRYEDLARFPLETSQKMYDFIGVEMTSDTKEFVYNKTMAGTKKDCIICSTRANSSEHIDRWKRKMNRQFLNIVNTECDTVIKHLNYEEFPERN